jgi:hypothetical protein
MWYSWTVGASLLNVAIEWGIGIELKPGLFVMLSASLWDWKFSTGVA